MAIAAQMICGARGADRLSVELDATLRGVAATPIAIEIEDISVTGFKMTTATELRVGELITVGIAGLGMQPAIVVRHEGASYGGRFLNTIPDAAIEQLQFGARQTVTPFVPASPVLPRGPEVLGDVVPDGRLPVPARLAIIVGLALSGWLVLAVVVFALL